MKLKGRRHSNRAVDHTVAKVTLPSQSRLKIKLENPYTIQGPICFQTNASHYNVLKNLSHVNHLLLQG